MQRKMEYVRRRLGRLPHITAKVLVVALIMGAILAVIALLDVVTITDGSGNRHTLLTASTNADEILLQAGLQVSESDKVAYTRLTNSTAEIQITNPFAMAVVADGETRTAALADGTVADLLAASGVSVGADDIVQPYVDAPLYEGLTVQVQRVRYVKEVRRQQLTAYQVANIRTQAGDVPQFNESRSGEYDITYLDRLVDGTVQDSEILEVMPLVVPRPADSYEFVPGVPCSRIEGFDDVQLGSDGLPQNYTRLMEDAITTAYSSSGGSGASGLGLYCGTVAVNPNVIPYGTRMYITSADGEFVYGFAIATDTGISLMEGVIDIDLYFETNEECLLFGKREMQVYILD